MPSKRDLLRRANSPKAAPGKKKQEGNLVDELIEDMQETAEAGNTAASAHASAGKQSAAARSADESASPDAAKAKKHKVSPQDDPADTKAGVQPLSFDLPEGKDKRTSIIIQDVNINYMNYIVAILKTNRQNYLSALIYREMRSDSEVERQTIPDFSRPVKKKKLPATDVSQQGIIIYDYAWDFAQQKADLLRETVSVYIDDLLTAERERFLAEHQQMQESKKG